MDALNVEVARLTELDFDINLLGLNDKFLSDLCNEEQEIEIEDMGEVTDLYQILIELPDDLAQSVLMEKLVKEGYKCRALIL